MEKLAYEFTATAPVTRAVRVGVVASGDLEVLLSPAQQLQVSIQITTAVNGKKATWDALLTRMFSDTPRPAAHIEINDNGATPGVVKLRLEQAFEQAIDTRPHEPTSY